MHTDTRSKMTNLKLKRDFIIKTVYTISIKTDFRIRGGILRFFLNFGWLLEDLNPLSIKLL